MKSFNFDIEKGSVVAFGDFDGVHIGHIEILKSVLEIAKENNLSPVIIINLNNEKNTYLTSKNEKTYILKKCGFHNILNSKIKDLPNLLERLNTKVLVVSETDKNINLYKEIANTKKIDLKITKLTWLNGVEVSKMNINNALESGNMKCALKLLGHPYIVIDKVVHGKGLGRQYGMPTANMLPESNKVLPKFGVYASCVEIDNKKYQAVTNIGMRPTVDNLDSITVESNILDFSNDIYGKTIVLEIFEYIRGIKKFNSLKDVKMQVDKDKEVVKRFFDNYKLKAL